jgi:hypothetical protein
VPKYSKRKTRKTPKQNNVGSETDPAQRILSQSARVFGNIYRSEKEPFILAAREYFNERVKDGTLKIDAAEKILNTPSILKNFLDTAKNIYVENFKETLLKARYENYDLNVLSLLETIQKNTSLPVVLFAGIVSGLVSGVIVAAVFSPFFAAYAQPSINNQIKNNASEITKGQAQIFYANISANNFNLSIGNDNKTMNKSSLYYKNQTALRPNKGYDANFTNRYQR